jgi:hypothetical protein
MSQGEPMWSVMAKCETIARVENDRGFENPRVFVQVSWLRLEGP